MAESRRKSDEENVSIDDIIAKRKARWINSTKGWGLLFLTAIGVLTAMGTAANLLWLQPELSALKTEIDSKYELIIKENKALYEIAHKVISDEAEDDNKDTNARIDRIKVNLLGTMDDKNAVVELKLENMANTEQILFDLKYASKEKFLQALKDIEYLMKAKK